MPSLMHVRLRTAGASFALAAALLAGAAAVTGAAAQSQQDLNKQHPPQKAPPPKAAPPRQAPPQAHQAPQQRQAPPQVHRAPQQQAPVRQSAPREERRVPSRPQINQAPPKSATPNVVPRTVTPPSSTLPKSAAPSHGTPPPVINRPVQGAPQGLSPRAVQGAGQAPVVPGKSLAPGLARPGVASQQTGPVRPVLGPRNFDQVRQGRVERAGPGGQRLIQEPGNRTIVKANNRTIITRNETTNIRNFAPSARITPQRNGNVQAVITRPGGARVFSDMDAQGRLLQRYRIDPGGRRVTLIDNRRFYRNLAIGVGIGILATAAFVALPPPAFALPPDRYIVDYERASDDDIYECLTAPPVETLDRVYSLEEIRYSEPLRARMRRIDLDSITFDFGSFEVTPDQYDKLARIARGLARAIEANPSEVYLIEGHTDAVGTEEDNLSLSDRRAEAVAHILVEHFNIPLENLVTQGYGKQFLKINTSEPERANRRVSMRRITPILSQQAPE